MVKVYNKKEEKKFTKSWKIEDYEILTDEGYVDIEYLHETIPYQVFEIKTASGKSLKCADDHIIFLSDMSEIFVKDLEIGDRIISKEGVDIIISVENLGYEESMYDFQLSENSNLRYYTNDILSHNTQLAKILAKNMFDSEDSLIRIDMSEYMEKFNVSKLIGSPPGYVGHDEGGQLTEKVRRKPYCVVLLDEIEKAHPDVHNLLLQVLDDGQLTDSLGRKISFKNCIIIMTSNIGARKVKDFGSGVGFMTKAKEESIQENANSVINKELRKAFAPEFINRIDEIIMFKSLEKADIDKIINVELDGLIKRINSLEFEFELSDEAKEFVASKGFDPEFGARPLKRAIQKYVEDPLTEELISSNPEKGSKLLLGYDKETDKITVKVVEKVD